ncbi:Rieske 2Fe-2S domain-containing protein [Marisediminicola senii]|uniref:Rieske 2Fe-2S domain-containing protein n=1 Tax=Marisediminicola senii TaxID=2711233 RepID=UPI0013EC8D4A|nr:Rieske 2Fe-2S domain-containing protein [Marisediminicola senii]
MRELRFVKALTALENAEALDPIVNKVKGIVNTIIQPQPVRDVLHGVPVGHAVHPAIILVPAGAWISAGALDLIPGMEKASKFLVGLGVLSAAPAVATGYTDWSEMHEQQMRVGIVHSAANAVATGLYAVSFIQRARGKHTSGKVLGFVGLALVSGAGFIGGHLSYRQAAGVNHAEEIPHRFPEGWQLLGPLYDFADNELNKAEVAGLPLLVLRRGDKVEVLSNTCSHLSAPLNEGELVSGDGGDPCVVCPWHASVFSMTTGEVEAGPATAPQPRFETRVVDGVIEVLLPNAG